MRADDAVDVVGVKARPEDGARGTLRYQAARIAGGYLLLATAWILLSDRVLGLLVTDPDVLVELSSVKGVAFVVATAGLLWVLLRRTFARVAAGVAATEDHERQVVRISRMYAALTAINQAIVRAVDPQDLYGRTCRALTDEAGFHAAWVALVDDDQLTIAACAGADGVPAQDITAAVDRMDVGPAATAIRHRRPYICQDLSAEDEGPWRELAQRNGLQLWAAVPVLRRDRVVAVLNVVGVDAEPLGQAEVALLTAAGRDLSAGLERLTLESEHRRAQATADAEKQLSDMMIESMPGVVYIYDEQGRFLRWNASFEKASGYTGEEIATMHPLDFFADADRALVHDRISQVFEGGDAWVEAPFLAKDGSARMYHFTGRRIDSPVLSGLVGVGIDITEREQAIAALQRLNETLEQRVDDRTAELQAAMVRAEAADRLKSAFLATMSHELRTPLNSIIGFTGILLQGLAGNLTDEQARQLQMVGSSARHLLALINDVLDISKIEAGELEMTAEEYDLSATIEHAVASITPQAQAKGLRLETTIAATGLERAIGDRRRVEQLLLNLLSNAVKFTEEGVVSLEAQLVEDPDSQPAVCVQVRDSGMGIRDEDLHRLFLPFSQVDSGLTRQHEGTGLGLAICQRLATLMRGTITADSTWGVGSRFTVTLPLTIERTP